LLASGGLLAAGCRGCVVEQKWSQVGRQMMGLGKQALLGIKRSNSDAGRETATTVSGSGGVARSEGAMDGHR